MMAWALVLPLVPSARAQDSPAVPPPAPTADDVPRNPVGEAWSLGSILPPADGSQPLQAPAIAGSDVPGSLLDVAYQSLFGDAYSEAAQAAWRPLRLGTFFTDGWNEPYIEPPAGSGGAPRSGWVNSFEGTFFRSWFLSFSFANQGNRNGNQYLGDYTIYAPLNRRFELRIDVPFIESNKGGANDTYHTDSATWLSARGSYCPRPGTSARSSRSTSARRRGASSTATAWTAEPALPVLVQPLRQLGCPGRHRRHRPNQRRWRGHVLFRQPRGRPLLEGC